MVKLDELENAINSETILTSIMFANNEIGSLQPIEQIGKITKKEVENTTREIKENIEDTKNNIKDSIEETKENFKRLGKKDENE